MAGAAIMEKRPPTEDAPEAPTSKRRHIEADDDYRDEDSTSTSSTPSSTNAESPITAATTPRAKFPSDYKTLACTWPSCDKLFNRPARLRDHMNSHTNSRPHKCPYPDCAKDYIEDKHLKQHIKATHKNDRRYACPRPGCGKAFVTGTRLKRHQAVHEGADRFRCGECGQSFRKKETLGTHVRREHRGERAYVCAEEGCEAGFDTKPALQRHRQREHGELKFWCSECGEQRVGFTTDAALQQHMKQEHQRCLFCDFRSTSQWEFLTHIDIHHSGKSLDDRRTVPCPHLNCRKRFTKRSNLNIHIRTAHEGMRFVCGAVALCGAGLERWSSEQGCGAKFSTKVRLEDHVRFTHLGHERPRLSSRIGAAEPENLNASGVIDELAGIAGEKRYDIACPDCGETFTRYFDLNMHIASAHGDMDDDDGQGNEAWAHSALLEGEENQDMAAAEMQMEMEMGLTPEQEAWLADDANLLMLAQDQAMLDYTMDPTLNGSFELSVPSGEVEGHLESST